MKKLIIAILSCFLLTGCSLLPRVTFDTKGTTPQATEKSLRKIKCKGDIILNKDGVVQACTKGYSEYLSNYEKKERKYTLKEKIINFFSNLMGWSFWLVIALIIFCPSVIGWLIGRTFNGFRTALEATVRGITRAKRNGGKYMDELRYEHAKNKGVKKIINQMRVNQE